MRMLETSGFNFQTDQGHCWSRILVMPTGDRHYDDDDDEEDNADDDDDDGGDDHSCAMLKGHHPH